MAWWRGLDPKARIALIAAAVVLVAGIATAIVLLGGDDAELPEAPAGLADTTETTQTPELEPGDTDNDEASEDDVVALPSTPVEKEPTPTEPSDEERVFGALRGIRDESGGSWQELWIDIDTADFLTGDAALAYLTSQGDQDFYSSDYWYVRDEGVAITSYRIPPSGQGITVTMYTFPSMPPIGFYGPDMDPQEITFGYLYDAIYMNNDSSGLLGRYFWFTVEEGTVVAIEEQPRDPYYEP